MATSDLTRIRSNIQGMNILSTLRDVNNSVATHQLRLGTGRRINSASDDPAGMSIATKLDNRNRILSAVYDNIGQAKNMLAVAEGGLLSINDILVLLSEKVISSASDSLAGDDRSAISTQLVSMVAEIGDIATQTAFGGTNILNSENTLNFQTGENTATTYQTRKYDAVSLGLNLLSSLTAETMIDSSNYQDYLTEISTALRTVSTGLTGIGSLTNRLTMKESSISLTQSNTEAAYSRIRNADMAQEQLELTKMQILQQTATSMLAQANTNSQSILTLFR
jgi:flagellin